MDEISFGDFQKVDIRIGTVVGAEVPSWSHWVMKLKVDLGSPPAGGGIKTAFSGIMKFFKPEDLIGKQFPFVVNLKPKTIGPDKEHSEVMMMMATPQAAPASNASQSDAGWQAGGQAVETPPVLFKLQKKVANGTRVL